MEVLKMMLHLMDGGTVLLSWRDICVYPGFECLCLVLAKELYGLTHVLVCG